MRKLWIARFAAVATISVGGLLLVPAEASNAGGDLTSQSTIEAYGSEGYVTKTDYSNGDSESVFAGTSQTQPRDCVGDYYSRNNTLYKWSPSSTSELGSCKEQSVSVTVKTVTVSESSTVCPETFGPYDVDTRLFTSKWDGQGSGPSNGAREVHGVSGWHSPSNANPTRSIRYTYWWA